eukprot:scaffold4233_cov27-Prasinocladus_malaysianus.AAC.3
MASIPPDVVHYNEQQTICNSDALSVYCNISEIFMNYKQPVPSMRCSDACCIETRHVLLSLLSFYIYFIHKCIDFHID